MSQLQASLLLPAQLAIALSMAVGALLLHARYPASWSPAQSLQSSPLRTGWALFEPAMAATLLWMLCYYCFLFHESGTTFAVMQASRVAAKKNGQKPPSLASVKYGSAGGVHTLRARRAVGNMIEQSGPFLVALWMHAAWVDAAAAARYAAWWIGFRGFYPLTFGRWFGNCKVPLLFAVTLPNYVVIVLMLWPTVQVVLN